MFVYLNGWLIVCTGTVVAHLSCLGQFPTKMPRFFAPAEFGLDINPRLGLHVEDRDGVRVGL